ncbi:hypothetical protein D3C81_1655580 [compost metagenome]
MLAQAEIETGAEQAFVTLIGPLTQLLQRCRANLTLWRVNDAQKCAVIILVSQNTQVGQQILDFRPREKRGATGNFVRDAVLHQHFFKQP